MKLFGQVQLFEYPNTIRGAKKPQYRILFGSENIRIPNTNTTILSNYFNSIRIPNYLSHPAFPPLKSVQIGEKDLAKPLHSDSTVH